MSNPGREIQEFLRAVLTDLREKRLLPVVIALVVAVVAIPVYVSRQSSSSAAPTPLSTPVAGATPAVSVAHKRTPHAPSYLGPLHDPFPKVPQASGATGATGPASGSAVRVVPTGTTGAGGATTPSSGTTGPAGSTPHGLQPTKPTHTSLKVYSVNLHFGQGTTLQAYPDFLRLDALPSLSTPVAQFLGVERNGKTAVFLLWNIRDASGDGACVAGVTPCDVLKLHAGGTEFIDEVSPNSGTIQYELVVDSIKVSTAATSADALAQHGKQSVDGSVLLLKSKSPALATMKYSTRQGVLVSGGAGAASANLDLIGLVSQYYRLPAVELHLHRTRP